MPFRPPARDDNEVIAEGSAGRLLVLFGGVSEAGSSFARGPRMRSPTAGGDGHEDLGVFTRKVAIVFGLAILGAVLWLVRDVLLLLVISAILAAGIAPAVRRVQIWARLYLKRRIRRGSAVLVVYLPFLLVVVLLLVFGVPLVINQSRELIAELPALIHEQIVQPLEHYIPMEEVSRFVERYGGNQPLPLFSYVRGAVTGIAGLISILFMIVYMLIDAERLRNLFLILYPADERSAKRKMIRRMSRRMSSWLGAQLLLAAIVGTATLVGLLILRIPYALPLAMIATIGELVPVIGPIIGAVPVLAVAILQSRWQFWSALALAILIQEVENYLLVPRLMGRRVKMSPLAVFVAFLVGATLFGIVGALIAVPAAAIIQVAFEEGFVAHRERRQRGDRPGSLLRRG